MSKVPEELDAEEGWSLLGGSFTKSKVSEKVAVEEGGL